jgi:translin
MLEEVIQRAAEELMKREKVMDKVMDGARRARMISKQAIFLVHNEDVKKAEKKLAEASQLLREIKKLVSEYPVMGCMEQVKTAQEEFTEASILHQIKKSKTYPSPETLEVSHAVYLMGLGDVPGELRRSFLDALRVGDLGLAESYLQQMERIYLNLIAMEEAPLLRGFRRKLDVSRSLIERTRGELATEVSRRRLESSVKSLADNIGKLDRQF